VPTFIGEYIRVCLAIDVAGSMRSKRVIEVLSRLVSVHGAPLFMRSHAASKTCPFADSLGRFPFV